ncbi:MAG TPA: hypothetical protein VKC62_03620, partial [Gaiellaceae bacterium]|nr:hypothetical protein [Gaiellaceae bacterium]
YLTIALTLTTAFAHGLVWLVPRLRVIALRTKTTKDDELVDRLARVGEWLASVLDVVQRITPRVQLGRPALSPGAQPLPGGSPDVIPPANGRPGGSS